MPGLSLSLSPALSLRQSIEIELEYSLLVIQEPRVELKLYKKREGTLTNLYKKALSQGNVRFYSEHEMEFEYALVSQKDIPEIIKKEGSALGFSHCLYNKFEAMLGGIQYGLSRGSWLLFVGYDVFPSIKQAYLEYTAVHERGEQVTLGNHNLASKLEFAIAKEEKRLVEYMSWIEENCPVKFADVFSYQTHLNLPNADEFQEILNFSTSPEEALKIQQMIEKIEWPYRLIQKLNVYRECNERVENIINQTFQDARFFLTDTTLPLNQFLEIIKSEIKKGLKLIVGDGLSRRISYARINPLWREQRIGLESEFVKMLNEKKKMYNEVGWIREITDAGISGELPRTDVLSLNFSEAIRFITS